LGADVSVARGSSRTLGRQVEIHYGTVRRSVAITAVAGTAAPSETMQRLTYFGSDTEVRLGDRIRYRAFLVLKLEGVVCYIPGVSPRHSDMEYDGLRHVGIRLRTGELRQLHWPAGQTTLGTGVTLLERGQPFKPLDPSEALDPTNDADA
jgi:hypothetical protein